jgi:hypothetical protein
MTEAAASAKAAAGRTVPANDMDQRGQRGTSATTLSRSASAIAGGRSVNVIAGGRSIGTGAGQRDPGAGGRGICTGAGNLTGTRRGGASARACRITATDCETKGKSPLPITLEGDVRWKERACNPPQGDDGVNARTFQAGRVLRSPQSEKVIPDSRRQLN